MSREKTGPHAPAPAPKDGTIRTSDSSPAALGGRAASLASLFRLRSRVATWLLSCGATSAARPLSDEAARADGRAIEAHRPAHLYFPVPVSGISWFAFPALSKMVSVERFRPVEDGQNSTVSLHFFFGISCAGQ